MRDHLMGWTGLVQLIEQDVRPSRRTPPRPVVVATMDPAVIAGTCARGDLDHPANPWRKQAAEVEKAAAKVKTPIEPIPYQWKVGDRFQYIWKSTKRTPCGLGVITSVLERGTVVQGRWEDDPTKRTWTFAMRNITPAPLSWPDARDAIAAKAYTDEFKASGNNYQADNQQQPAGGTLGDDGTGWRRGAPPVEGRVYMTRAIGMTGEVPCTWLGSATGWRLHKADMPDTYMGTSGSREWKEIQS